MEKQNNALSHEEIRILKQVVKQIQDDKKDEAESEKNTKEMIKKHLCKKCKGVRVNSFITSVMAASHGRACKCK